jgi:hypothetical protein
MDDRLAEAAPESDVLIDADVLVAEEHDRVVHKSIWISWNCWFPSG